MNSVDEIVKQEHFCSVPFIHLYYFTDGNVYPCPALAGNKKYLVGNSFDTPEKLWNSDVLKAMRLKMLKNEKIGECHKECFGALNSCKKYLGDESLDCAKKNIPTVKSDGSSDLNFGVWNIIEGNRCNLKCTYCNSQYSTSWLYDEKTVFGYNSFKENSFKNSDLIKVYDDNYNNLEEIWFAGGEPAIQDSTYYFLNKIIADKKQVRIRFITNLMFSSYKGNNLYDLLSKFDDCIIFGSWDLDSERGEYIRTNSDTQTIEQNIKEINKRGIKFILQSVMSCFNLFYYPEYHKRLFEKELVQIDNVRYYNLNYPEIFRYSILKQEVKDNIKYKIEDYKKWLLSKTDNFDTYANKESPIITLDKIIDTMYTGKWGHWNYDETKHDALREEMYDRLTKLDMHRHGRVIFKNLFSDIFI